MKQARSTNRPPKTSTPAASRWPWWCPGTTLLQRKQSTPDKPTSTTQILFGRSYADILGTQDDGRLRLDYGRFHDTVEQG